MTSHQRVDCVIWDFNGTLIDDLDLVVRSVNDQLEKRGLAALTSNAYRDVFGFPVEDYYRRIGVTFENETIADLSADFFATYAPALEDCPLHDAVLDVLRQFRTDGVRQFVLSAMEEGMLRRMIQHLRIEHFFEAIYGLAHQKADSKLSRGQELKQAFDMDPASTLLIGDTAHDAEVAEELGMSVALVSLGHQSPGKLRETGCTVYESYRDLSRAQFHPS